ncbi:MAG TPA: polysaccharide pyruvyl transferase family protein [Polyangiaceae bacterium]|jgi:hypothetical protein|nr:polysaccharide pyruvyl transferase family protein [Polyangiaceae bacterium]
MDSFPVIVSFYAGPPYYREAADRLREDCRKLTLPCDIVGVETGASDDWADVCRMKIRFYKQMLDKHPDGIFWVDVDTRILRVPDVLRGRHHDFGAFLRRFRDLRDYDPVTESRTFVPGFLHFPGTEGCRAFVEHLVRVDAESPKRATDDYVLEEAFRTFDRSLNVLAFSSALVARFEEKVTDQTCFLVGSSGNVQEFSAKVEQHDRRLFDVRRQRTLLNSYAEQATKRHKRRDALVFLAQAHRVDPAHQGAALSLAKLQLRTRNPSAAISTLKRSFGRSIEDDDALQIAVDSCFALGEFERATNFLDKLAASSAPAARAYEKSRRFRVSLELRAKAMGVSQEDRPALWWMETPFPGNFGDVLNPYVVERLSGLPPRYVPAGDGILAIGSIIKFAKAGTKVWGAGTPRMTDNLSPAASYLAVRGPLTRELVLRSGGDAPPRYGDPALLLPRIRPARSSKKYRLGLIRHGVHVDQPIDLEDVREISVLRIGYDEIEAFIDDVTECEAIISTSLHGLIVAHAYGIPARWATFGGAPSQIAGDGTKFHDHFMALGIAKHDPIDLSVRASLTAADAALCDEVATIPVDAEDLLSVAPFPLSDPPVSG